MSEHILLPQPPLTPEQISLGKDVEIRRLNDVLAALTLRWSTEKPTQPGWYWWRVNYKDGEFIERVFRVAKYNDLLYVPDFDNVSKMEGEWAGPISPPLEAPQ